MGKANHNRSREKFKKEVAVIKIVKEHFKSNSQSIYVGGRIHLRSLSVYKYSTKLKFFIIPFTPYPQNPTITHGVSDAGNYEFVEFVESRVFRVDLSKFTRTYEAF